MDLGRFQGLVHDAGQVRAYRAAAARGLGATVESAVPRDRLPAEAGAGAPHIHPGQPAARANVRWFL